MQGPGVEAAAAREAAEAAGPSSLSDPTGAALGREVRVWWCGCGGAGVVVGFLCILVESVGAGDAKEYRHKDCEGDGKVGDQSAGLNRSSENGVGCD